MKFLNSLSLPLRSLSALFVLMLLGSMPTLHLRGQTIPAMPTEFSVSGYLVRNADLRAVFSNDQIGAWQHYYLYGVKESRRFDGEFLAAEYLELYGDLKLAFGTNYQAAMMHWFSYGRTEGRMGGAPEGFDAEAYLNRAPDVRAALGSSRVGAWMHYLNYGVYEGRTDGEFNVTEYLAMYSDLRAAFGNDLQAAALHWYLYGRNEGRRIPPGFSVVGYFARNPDVQAVAGHDFYAAWLHYLYYGINDGRTFDDEFRVDEYLARYADLQAAFGTDRSAALLHWLYYGRSEGRLGRTEPVGYSASAAAVSDAEAARFLIQASFGPTAEAIARVRSITYTAWIDEQIATIPSYHMPYYQARAAEFETRSDGDGYLTPRQEAWWQYALSAPDQLRQRMGFALSEILVISQDSSLDGEHAGATAYYDLLLRNAFGNYRQLLEEVTLSPMMGTYLSMIRNRKPNVRTGSQPDENYAREIMQLFSIGLSELNIDGTLRLDANGRSIPTYTQADIVGLAHVFTGWGPHFDPVNPPKWDDGTVAKANDWFSYGWDPIRPMTFNINYGDLKDRQILRGVIVPGLLTGPQRLKLALDTLFNHPNVGPFIGRQLIQRFVTSNPSPVYISHVAAAFNDNGMGVRGDLGATLRAVLLDPEAREAAGQADPKFGKLTEPLLRMTRLFRALPLTPRPYAASGDNRMFLNFVYNMDEQSPLFSPTVFNFFKPGFSKAGPIAQAGLVSPEFQIFDDVTAMLETNRNYGFIYSGVSVGEPTSTGTNMKLDLTEPLAILTTTVLTHPAAQAVLVDYFDKRLLGGNMSPFLRQKILDTFTSLPASFTYTAANERKRVQLALYLVLFSPEFNVQR